MELIDSEKALIRGVAKVVINNKKDVISLLKKHYQYKEDVTTNELVSFLMVKLATDPKFADEFTDLMVRKKALILTDNKKYHGFVAAIVTAVAGLASNIVGGVKAKREGEAAKDNVTSEMLKALAAEKDAKLKKEKMQNSIIIVSMIVFASVAGIVIYKKM